MQKIGVTAASGKLGAEIVRATVNQVGKDHVIALARTPSRASELGVEVRPGDYGALETLKGSLDEVGTLLLVSGMDAPEKRVVQHRNVIEAAKSVGVKKIVYTSIQGADSGTAFSPVVQSNRQTEKDLISSGLQWVVGRNGIYIEPDVEYLDEYKRAGKIANCAGEGKCGYTTRGELAYAYSKLLVGEQHNGKTYNLHGELLTQTQLAAFMNSAFGTDLQYVDMTVEEYRKERIAELGDFLGGVIAGIYEGIRLGAVDNPSDYARAAGREHQDWDSYFNALRTR